MSQGILSLSQLEFRYCAEVECLVVTGIHGDILSEEVNCSSKISLRLI